jgi:hypothetical protein
VYRSSQDGSESVLSVVPFRPRRCLRQSTTAFVAIHDASIGSLSQGWEHSLSKQSDQRPTSENVLTIALLMLRCGELV